MARFTNSVVTKSGFVLSAVFMVFVMSKFSGMAQVTGSSSSTVKTQSGRGTGTPARQPAPTPPRITAPIEIVRESAENGLASFQYELGLRYIDGTGVPKNYVEAYRWLNLAAAGGVQAAASRRELLTKEMTREQIADGQSLSVKPLQQPPEEANQPKEKSFSPPPGSKVVSQMGTSFGSDRKSAIASSRTQASPALQSQCMGLSLSESITFTNTGLDYSLRPDYQLVDYVVEDLQCTGPNLLATAGVSCTFRARGYCEDRNKEARAAALTARDAEIDSAERFLTEVKSVNAVGTYFNYNRSFAEQQAVQMGAINLGGACARLPLGSYTLNHLSTSFTWKLGSYKVDHLDCNTPFMALPPAQRAWSCTAQVLGNCEPYDKDGLLGRLPHRSASKPATAELKAAEAPRIIVPQTSGGGDSPAPVPQQTPPPPARPSLTVTHSSDTRDMTGTWNLNLGKSTLDANHARMVEVLTIQQSGDTVTIKARYATPVMKDQGDSELEIRGENATFVLRSTKLKKGKPDTSTGTAKWESGSLVTVLKIGWVEQTEKYSLTSDGGELVKILTRDIGKSGEFQKFVYDKASK